ncbi:glutathione S-transferase family protein [Minwuia thermotolerans]|uniref:Glutathione S-transferase family protein n=1 Tax=Minwuia thermotolerans TaxID=2056226 RepID=A0A2M9G6I0_9PROT|nr:glutathione S-transferase family protein [Minwuia thermotolerans]PJK31314.1 glutathione S-transferase family protein [Minwuia thermotolerans]
MPETYRIFGSELSPYSVKIRSWFRYKGLPHVWTPRTEANMAEFEKYAALPLIPLVVTPEDEGMQDSTPIIESLEKRHPQPPTDPADPRLRFLSRLIEEYADEWGNKPMFHYRWAFAADAESTGLRIARQMLGDDAGDEAVRNRAVAIVERMMPRRSFVGSSAETAGEIEASLESQLQFLEARLDGRDFLMGSRPCLGDFGLFSQLYEASTDPTAGSLMRDIAPGTLKWIERMLDPTDAGEWESYEQTAEGLRPLLEREIGGRFLPWSDANAEALARGDNVLEVELPKGPFRQQPQKYHARSLKVLKDRYAAVAGDRALDGLLADTGCLDWLRKPMPS